MYVCVCICVFALFEIISIFMLLFNLVKFDLREC